MSGRRHVFRDPTARSGMSEDALNRVVSVLVNSFSKREQSLFLLRYGVQDRQPRTYHEIGEVFGVTRGRVIQLLDAMTTKMNAALDAEGLVAEDLLPDVRELRQRLLSAFGPADAKVTQLPSLAYCPIHDSWSDPGILPDWRPPTCGYCPCILGSGTGNGRRRKYCSDACKQSAYRNRKLDNANN
ncbi:hypothetical protein GCM10009609_75950 [Pseudonocardia aurantiaca]|uniref:Sigma factor-like helix-turn-helix DNA-binding protein n=1 Tax=Pseudonocardia aurantiaca TaxID=75290 RepID=A0ABW4FZP3_9PSEU